jgi:hypothetical protein
MPQPSVRNLILLIAAASLLVSAVVARADDCDQPIKIYVDSILATYSPNIRNASGAPSIKMDPRLNKRGIAARLRMMFAYNDYQLRESQEFASECGGAVAFNLPGGHILHVAPIDYVGSELALALTFFEGQRVIMQIPIKLIGGGMLLLVDEHLPGQFYITAISADSPVLAHVQLSPGLLPEIETPVKVSPALIPAQ